MTHGSVVIIRSGSWNYRLTRVKDRNRFTQGQRLDFLGLRLARVVNPFQQIAEMTAHQCVSDQLSAYMEE